MSCQNTRCNSCPIELPKCQLTNGYCPACYAKIQSNFTLVKEKLSTNPILLFGISVLITALSYFVICQIECAVENHTIISCYK